MGAIAAIVSFLFLIGIIGSMAENGGCLAVVVAIPIIAAVRYTILAIWYTLPPFHPVFMILFEIAIILGMPALTMWMAWCLLDALERRGMSRRFSVAIFGLTFAMIISVYLWFSYICVPSSTYGNELWWMDNIWAGAIIILYAGGAGLIAGSIRQSG